ncbi:hypothetical protein CPLU01_15737 [Colletotrichum plurivorum]|uniref:Uncharacterized protein n=1 Tax=Colletotrichum plurivorum TaxID=2175906 RepID=A0A8H6J7G5_9PEZI|nr:hypothetical protein CPLU01_15737 [Colletotrichum plurivorum]
MAPTLAQSQHNLIRDMLTDGSFTNAEMTTAARCSPRAVQRIGLSVVPSSLRRRVGLCTSATNLTRMSLHRSQACSMQVTDNCRRGLTNDGEQLAR